MDTVSITDSQILNPTGGMDAPTNAADRREPNIKFVTISVSVIFSFITNNNDHSFDVVTSIEVNMTNPVAGNVNVHTFQEEADLRTLTNEDFKANILDIT